MSEDIVLKLSNKSALTELTWVIDNCFKLFQRDRLKYSPAFVFASSKWRIRVNSCCSGQQGKWIIFALERMDNYYDSDLPVEFKFEIRNRDGTTLISWCDVKNFKSGYSDAQKDFLRDEIMVKKNLFGPKGELTVFCELRLKNESGTEASTQTEGPLVGLKNTEEATTQTIRYSPSGDKLAQDFIELLKSGERSDVTFKVQEKEFKAHRTVLDARTPVSCKFRLQMAQSTTGVVNIEDCEPDVFEDFLHYVYAATLRNRSLDRMTCLYGFAEKYQVTELKAQCTELMADCLSVETFCGILTLALRYRDEELVDLTTAFFLLNKKEIFATVEWQDFVVRNPIQVTEFFLKSVLV